MSGLPELERGLLTRPFDVALRLEYADRLLRDGAYSSALAQFEILEQTAADNIAARIGLARTLLALGRDADAMRTYAAARSLDGFESDPQLEECAARSGRVPPKLGIIAGGKTDNVVSFRPPPGRERIGFDDIAGLADLKRIVRLQIIEPFLRPGLFERFRKKAGGGVLLYGPPGCGKTMLARAVATECNAEFVSVGIADVLNMYIGESERNLAAIFEKARQNRPCVLFFDEIDALAFARSKAQSEHTRQVVNELLSQLDGFAADNQGVLILAATNMPWDVDSAMKRPGRFSRQVFVPPPDAAAREHIITLQLQGVPHADIDARSVATATPHFSGADIAGIVELAKDYVIEEHVEKGTDRPIGQDDLIRAARAAQPSTLHWLRTARNLVKYAGADEGYREVEAYLKEHRIT